MVGGISYHPYRQYATTSQPVSANIGKRERTKFRPDQLQYLEMYFNSGHRYPQGPERETLASQLRLSETVVQVWFKNRRAKEKADKKFNELREKAQTGGSFKQLDDSPADLKKAAYEAEEHPAEPGGTEEENEAPKPSGNKLLPGCYPAHMPFIPLPPTMTGAEGAKQEETTRTDPSAPTSEAPLSQTGHSWSPQAAWMHMNSAYSSMFPFNPTAYPSGFAAAANGYPNLATLPYADQFAYAPGYYNPATTMPSVLPHTANYFKFP
ncbi:homeobox domain-containing protein [Aphelenchoides avenae]|nr:homeobox domain-containing protein [Aphelenchus avenae]